MTGKEARVDITVPWIAMILKPYTSTGTSANSAVRQALSELHRRREAAQAQRKNYQNTEVKQKPDESKTALPDWLESTLIRR
jgi:beta-lactamase class D